MGILKSKYKNILRKLDLSLDQLEELKNKLQPQNICVGPFIKGEKMCPNTTALSLKLNKRVMDKSTVKRLFRSHGITNVELLVFYLLFDVPAMVSDRLFTFLLKDLQNATIELIHSGFTADGI